MKSWVRDALSFFLERWIPLPEKSGSSQSGEGVIKGPQGPGGRTEGKARLRVTGRVEASLVWAAALQTAEGQEIE